MLGKESSDYLKEYQKQFMPEDADAGMILSFLDDFKGDRVCSKLLWKEALRRDYEPKRIELKQICDIMNNSVTDWVNERWGNALWRIWQTARLGACQFISGNPRQSGQR